jgi:hypothetical protein
MVPELPEASVLEIAGPVWDALANTPPAPDADVRDPRVQAAIRSSLATAAGASWTDLERRIRLLLKCPPCPR